MDCSGDESIADKVAAVAGKTSLHDYAGTANDISNRIGESKDTECGMAFGMDKNRMTLRVPQIYPVFNLEVLDGLDNRGRYFKSLRFRSIQPFFQKGPVLAQFLPCSDEPFKYASRAISRYLRVNFKQQRFVTLNELRCRARLEYHRFRGLTSVRLGTIRLIVCAACLHWANKLCFHIARYFNTTHNFRPKLKRRCLDQHWIKCDVVKIVMQKGAAPTVPRVASRPDTGTALTPMAGTANVIPGWIDEEDVGTFVSALSSTLQSSTCGRQRGEVGITIDRNQHVCIFRIVLLARQRADKGDSPDARARASAFDKAQDFAKQELANRRITVCHSRHHVRRVFMVPNVEVTRGPLAARRC